MVQETDAPARTSGTEDQDGATDRALKALRERPKFSIRMQIYLAVALSLIISFGPF